MKRLTALALLLSFCVQSALAASIRPEEFKRKPKLVLVLVVDQMRADYITRFSPRFLPAKAKNGQVGGYQFLATQGAYFPFAEYDVLQCMTGPGHAMILSGSYPYQMGIPLNVWFDSASQKPVYCVSDNSQPIVGSDSKQGMSPKNFTGDTVGDELKNAGYPSRVISLSLKDRAAILMGGHRSDLSLWMDFANFKWVSSRFYLPDGKLPGWMNQFNDEIAKRKGRKYSWKTAGGATGLTLGGEFDHQATIGSKDALFLPFGLELTEEAAEKAIEAYHLGQGKASDVLAVSFSSHDLLGHKYGPNSREMEEMTVAEDRVISKLLNYVSKSVPGGLKDVAIVLTADHGVAPSPAWLAPQRMDAGRIKASDAIEAIETRLISRFGKPGNGRWIPFQSDLNFYISPEALADRNVTREAAEQEAKLALTAVPGIARVFSRTDYEKRILPPGMFERGILKTYIPGRSGDVVAIPKPFYMIDDDPVVHMTSYAYDRTVPLMIYAPGKVRPGVYNTHADIIDVAPTLSFMLGVISPSTSEGRVLSEIF